MQKTSEPSPSPTATEEEALARARKELEDSILQSRAAASPQTTKATEGAAITESVILTPPTTATASVPNNTEPTKTAPVAEEKKEPVAPTVLAQKVGLIIALNSP